MSDALAISTRGIRDTDQAFLRSSWKKSFRDSRDQTWIPSQLWFRRMEDRINELLERSTVVVACDPGDPNYILGWAVIEGPVVHYVYVRQALRRARVAQRLLGGVPSPVACSHWSHWCETIETDKPGSLRYEPSKLEKSDAKAD